jgi:ADP-ribose pyrophosphatase YjhB (NUDIX family)
VTQWANAKPCAGICVTDAGGRLLLFRRANEPWKGLWDIPGGFCEADEHPMTAAAREAREETGFEVEVTGFIGMWLDRYPDPSDPAFPKITLNAYYHGRAGAQVGEPDPHETAELRWFDPDDLPADVAFPAQAHPVLAAWRQAVKNGTTVSPLPDRP